MSEYVRKIDKAKWFQLDILNSEDISADAITVCMRTQGNKLSVWQIESENNIDEAALAIIAAHDYLETINVVMMSPEFMNENGIASEHSAGQTRVNDLKNIHYDLLQLTYSKLGILAHHTVERIRANRIKRYTRDAQRNLLLQAIEGGRLRKEDLSESVRNKL